MLIELTDTLLKNLTLAKANALLVKADQATNQARADIGDKAVRGLTIRITKKGKKTWTLTYTSPVTGKQKRERLGCYGAEEHGGVTLDMARTRASALKTGIQNEIDPQVARLAAAPAKLLGAVIDERMEMEVRGKLRSADSVQRIYDKHLAKLRDMSIKDFKVNPHYNDIINPYKKADKYRMGARVRSALLCLFEYAFKQDYIDTNPLLKTEDLYKYEPKDRSLSDEEIAALWKSLPTAFAKAPRTQRVIKMLLATGQRCGEVAGMREEEIVEISPTEWVWVIPGNVRHKQSNRLITEGRTKNGKTHIVPLNPLAIALIKENRKLNNGSPYIFPNRDGKPSTSTVIANTIWVAQRAPSINNFLKFGCDDWTAHTLRHTVVTQMQALGIADSVLSKVVNHAASSDRPDATGQSKAAKGSNVTSIYKHYKFDQEKREAMLLWGAHLAKLAGLNIDPPKLRLVA